MFPGECLHNDDGDGNMQVVNDCGHLQQLINSW